MVKKLKMTKNVVNNKELLGRILAHLGDYCPKCGTERTEQDLAILGQMNNMLMVHIGCKKCGTQDVFHFVANVGYSSTGGIVTDVSPDEAKSFLKSPNVSKDDMLDMYLVLRDVKSSGDFLKKVSVKRLQPERRVVKAPVPSGAPIATAA